MYYLACIILVFCIYYRSRILYYVIFNNLHIAPIGFNV